MILQDKLAKASETEDDEGEFGEAQVGPTRRRPEGGLHRGGGWGKVGEGGRPRSPAGRPPGGKQCSAGLLPLGPPSECTQQLTHATQRNERHIFYLPGMILSGPFLEVISVNSLRILAAFFASDFKLEGIGLFTERLKRRF